MPTIKHLCKQPIVRSIMSVFYVLLFFSAHRSDEEKYEKKFFSAWVDVHRYWDFSALFFFDIPYEISFITFFPPIFLPLSAKKTKKCEKFLEVSVSLLFFSFSSSSGWIYSAVFARKSFCRDFLFFVVSRMQFFLISSRMQSYVLSMLK